MSKKLHRRTFLAGLGTLIALPALEAMMPGSRTARADVIATPKRFMTFHFPTGVNREAWKPTGTETSWSLGASQSPLIAHKNDVSMITGVNIAGLSVAGAHTSKAAAFLTAKAVPPGTGALGTSADQLIAAFFAGSTPFRSLELGTSILNENPNEEPGFDPVLKDHLSWSNGTPLPKEVNPSALFDRLFTGTSDPLKTSKQGALRQSVLDAVTEDANRLQRQLGRNDSAKLDEYLTSVRELEVRIQATGKTCAIGQRPGPPADVRDRVKQMLDLSVLAFRCDLTRVITFGYEHTVTEQTHPWLGFTDGYHQAITHHQPARAADYAAVNKWIVSQLAYLLDQMKAVTEGDATMLDNTIVYFSSEMGFGNGHDGTNLPMIVCGGRNGLIPRQGRLLSRPGQENGNVLIALMNAMGVSVETFGDGYSQPLPGLL